jgi:radical SAM protein
MQLIRQPRYDLGDRPFLVIWETTRACDLACRHCRAEASPVHDPDELTTSEARSLIDQVEAFGVPRPLFIMTGGDPFKRSDIFELVTYASDRGLPVAVSPSGTPLLTAANLQRLKAAGAKAISLSLDGSTAEIHDDFRRVAGSYNWTVSGWKEAQAVGLKIQINSTVTRANVHDLPRLFALVRSIGAMTWSLFFLVPTGRGRIEDEISPADYEAVMNFLYDASKYIGLKTTEGHHYKRVVLQRAALEARGLCADQYMALDGLYYTLRDALQEVTRGEALPPPADHMRRTPMHVNSADGFVFISLKGEVCPSGYLPVVAGNVRQTSLADIYRDSPLFRVLRDKAQLKGRCGRCEYRAICGGSRSRAYGMTGDLLAEETFCSYEPGSFPFSVEMQQAAAPATEQRR